MRYLVRIAEGGTATSRRSTNNYASFPRLHLILQSNPYRCGPRGIEDNTDPVGHYEYAFGHVGRPLHLFRHSADKVYASYITRDDDIIAHACITHKKEIKI